MATTDIINYMQAGADVDSMNRRKVESFISAGAIAANDVVSLDGNQSIDADVALYIVKADSDTAATNIPVGIALDSAAGVGEVVRVVVRVVLRDLDRPLEWLEHIAGTMCRDGNVERMKRRPCPWPWRGTCNCACA